MSREIKFRGWDKVEKVLCPVKTINLEKGCFLVGNSPTPANGHFFQIDEGHFVNFAGLEIMQFTGLTDKNGKEIYEGDIVKVLHRFDDEDLSQDFETTGRVEYSNAAFWINGDGYAILQHFHFNNSDREIIGNIYENPELLK